VWLQRLGRHEPLRRPCTALGSCRVRSGGGEYASSFKAFRIHSEGGRICARYEPVTLDEPAPGESDPGRLLDTTTRTRSRRRGGQDPARYQLVGGIDLAGVVGKLERYRTARRCGGSWTGCGLSDTHDGGYAAVRAVPGDGLIPLPQGRTPSPPWRSARRVHSGTRHPPPGTKRPSPPRAGDRGHRRIRRRGRIAVDMIAARG